MIRPRHLLAAALALGLSACAVLRTERPPAERDASYRLDRGLAAVEAGQYREAFEDLAWVYTNCPDRSRGAEALVALSALELDPRNRAGRPGLGSDLLARVLGDPRPADYVRPLAETAYLMGLSLGAPPGSPAPGMAAADGMPVGQPAAPEPDSGVRVVRAADVLAPPADEPVYGCGAPIVAEAWIAPPLPTLPGPSLVELVAEAERARDASAAASDSLRRELAGVRQRLEETEAELERIRRTLKP